MVWGGGWGEESRAIGSGGSARSQGECKAGRARGKGAGRERGGATGKGIDWAGGKEVGCSIRG